jgi:hypothetical protein
VYIEATKNPGKNNRDKQRRVNDNEKIIDND